MDGQDLDIVHNDFLRIQQEPELSFILLVKRGLEIFFFSVRRQHHQRRIGPFEPHIQHSLDANAASFESLSFQLGADVRFEFVQAGEESRQVGGGIERGRGFLQFKGSVCEGVDDVQVENEPYNLPIGKVETVRRQDGAVSVDNDRGYT